MSQTAKAVLHSDVGGCVTEEVTAPAAGEYGDVIQTADGKAAVVMGADKSSSAISSGDTITVAKTGQFKCLKTSSVVLLAGGKAYWDRSAEKADYHAASGDFYLGRIVEDAGSSDTEVIVELNVEPWYPVELGTGQWTTAATEGEGVSLVAEGGSTLKLSFDAVAEEAMAALYSVGTVPCADGPIFEGKIAIYDIGDDAALDINFGLANGTHATDFDSVTESCVFHLDGSALSINAESDDDTTEVNATDTNVDAVEETYAEYWIDARDLTDIAMYVDGVQVLSNTTFKLDDATGPLKPIIHLEKTSNNTEADVRVEWMRVRSTDLTS